MIYAWMTMGLLTMIVPGCKKTDSASAPVIVVDIDGNYYHTVKIGNQVWMAENLRVTHYRNGDAIPTDIANGASALGGRRSYYNEDSATNNPVYGALYNWFAATDPRNICPAGWHIPSDEEWTQLTDYLGGDSVAGGKLKYNGGNWTGNNTGATNETGFAALPGGYYDVNNFNDLGERGFWWSSEGYSYPTLAWYRFMSNNTIRVGKLGYNKRALFSVRCIKN